MPKVSTWRDLDCAFTTIEIPAGSVISLDRLFHEDITLLSFVGCTWTSRSRGQSHVELERQVVLRDGGEVFSADLGEVAASGGLCREFHIPQARLRQVYEALDSRQGLDYTLVNLKDPQAAEAIFALHQASEQRAGALETESRLLELIALLLRHRPGWVSRPPPTDEPRIGRVIDYMHGHYMDNISLDELAAAGDINPFVLIRLFKRQFGLTPYDYLRALRINKARKYMLSGQRLADVAQLCGFADQSHMVRHFKQRTGFTPRSYLPVRR